MGVTTRDGVTLVAGGPGLGFGLGSSEAETEEVPRPPSSRLVSIV